MQVLRFLHFDLTKNKYKNGFTLIEMIIVVSIILILATMAVPKLVNSVKTAKVAKIQADMRTVSNAAALYEAENGQLPTDLNTLAIETHGKRYLQSVPRVPDGTEYTLDKDGVVSCTFDSKPYKSTDQPENDTK